MIRRLLVLGVAAAAGVFATHAGAAGPWPGVVDGYDGVLASTGDVRYVTLPAAGRTLVEKIRVRDGRVLAFAAIRGRYGIPAVTLDGTTGGLTRDGSRLVLGQPPDGNGRTVTSFAVLDARKLRLVRTITLRGDFGYDALSPDGRTMYLIEHATGDPFHYVVRALDLRTSKLLAAPIVDKSEPSEDMAGFPLKRAASADGSWVYTLYMRQNGGPFVHALDAAGRSAHCIDIPWRGSTDDLWNGRFALDAKGSLVVGAGGKQVTIDTKTFEVTA